MKFFKNQVGPISEALTNVDKDGIIISILQLNVEDGQTKKIISC